jgi:antitoxin FitA
MGKIEIDSVEDRVMAGLEAEAMVHGRTLTEHVRALLASHVLLRREERLRIIDEIRAMTPKGVNQTDSTEMIRALRDANYDLD